MRGRSEHDFRSKLMASRWGTAAVTSSRIASPHRAGAKIVIDKILLNCLDKKTGAGNFTVVELRDMANLNPGCQERATSNRHYIELSKVLNEGDQTTRERVYGGSHY